MKEDLNPITPSVALRVTLQIIGHMILIASLLLAIGYVDAKGEEIDKHMTTILK